MVGRLRNLLIEAGIRVWWDREIYQGEFAPAIQNAIRTANCVIPIWSARSAESSWVRDEVRYATDVNVPVIGIKLDKTPIPVGLGVFATHDLFPWSEQKPVGFEALVGGLKHLTLSETPKNSFLTSRGGKLLQLPAFIRSVSSHETFLPPLLAAKTIGFMKTDGALVSSYDIAREQGTFLKVSNGVARSNTVLFLDSGNYESSRKGDRGWTAAKFIRTLSKAKSDFVLSFDNVNPANTDKKIVEDAIHSFRRIADRTAADVIPIIHLPRKKSGVIRHDSASDISAKVLEQTAAAMIAVPERELGDGIVARAAQVSKIRRQLDRMVGARRYIHLLGTGNPISFAILAAVGADSFDGLEWCRTVVDEESLFLFHTQHFDFFRYQSDRSLDPLVRAVMSSSTTSYGVKIAVHNLWIMSNWVAEVRNAAATNTMDRLLNAWLPKGAFEQLHRAVPDAFA
jgi:hypothetical protein